jgi:hypothetical protein
MRTPEPLVGAVLAAAALSGAILLSASDAHAAPKKTQVQLDCEEAGGKYVRNSPSSESCCFEEALDDENHHCKEFIAGEYVGVSRDVTVGPGPAVAQLDPLWVPRAGRQPQ